MISIDRFRRSRWTGFGDRDRVNSAAEQGRQPARLAVASRPAAVAPQTREPRRAWKRFPALEPLPALELQVSGRGLSCAFDTLRRPRRVDVETAYEIAARAVSVLVRKAGNVSATLR